MDLSLSILLRVFIKFSLEIAPSAYSPSMISPDATRTANLFSDEFSFLKRAKLSLREIFFPATNDER